MMYRILHAVQCNSWCIDGSCDLHITACNTVHLAMYWWFKWSTHSCMQYIAPGIVLIVQVMYRLLLAVHCTWRWINGSIVVQITACITVHLAVYWFFKWFTIYCIQYCAPGGVLVVQVIYRLQHAVQCNWRGIGGSIDVQITACSTLQLAVYYFFKLCTDYCLQYSATCVVLMIQVIYTLLLSVPFNCRGNDGSSDVQITACITL